MQNMDRRQFNKLALTLGTAYVLSSTGKLAIAKTNVEPETLLLQPNDWVPNNQHLPVLLYRQVITTAGNDPAANFEAVFNKNGWPAAWRYTIFPFHHYHVKGHEVLGFATGTAKLMLGGPNGHVIDVHPGDVALLPAGTGHRQIEASSDFMVVGAYPPGETGDVNREAATPAMLRQIAQLPFPNSDPTSGAGGPTTRLWQHA